MKQLTEEQIAGHDAASRRGAIEGALASGAIGSAGMYYAHRNFPKFRRLPITLKTLGMVLIMAPCLSIQAERRGLAYDMSQWEGETGMHALQSSASEEQRIWQSLTAGQKVTKVLLDNKYSFIFGGWVVGMGVAGTIISRRPHQTTINKLVQTRVFAQGFTVALLVGAGLLSYSQRNTGLEQAHVDHSWMKVLEEREYERQMMDERMKGSQRVAQSNTTSS